MKSTLFSKNSRWYHRIVALMLLATLAITCGAFAGEELAGSNAPINPTPQVTAGDGGNINTFWSLTKLGGGVSVAIFGVLALGLFLIIMQVYELTRDKIRGRALLNVNYRSMSVNEVSKLVMKQQSSLAARLYSVLLSIFHTTGNTRDFHDEIANYIQLQQDRFNIFKNRLAFLSDTAGALGLLGTVWGMFVTFFGGNLDSQRILNGMGLALVTTLIGLVVSIILNFFSTEVFSAFNRRLELISSKADEFRLWLMAIVQQRNKKNGAGSSSGSSGSSYEEPERARSAAARPGAKMPSLELKTVHGDQYDGIIGHPVARGIAVAVRSSEGTPVAGVPVRFEVTNGGGSFATGSKQAFVKTDTTGIATTAWTLGPEVGTQKVVAAISEDPKDRLTLTAFAQPVIPNLHEDEQDSFGLNRTSGGVA